MPLEVFYQNVLQYSKENTCAEVPLNKVAGHKVWSFIKKRLQLRRFPVNIKKFLKNLLWRTSAYGCFLRDFRKWLIGTFILESCFQNHPDFVTLQK